LKKQLILVVQPLAINILSGYIPSTLTYADELKTPLLVQNAKRGQHQLKQQKYIDLLQQYLLDDQEEQALRDLLTRLLNNNISTRCVWAY
jgi:hypothetical protein